MLNSVMKTLPAGVKSVKRVGLELEITLFERLSWPR